MNKKKMLKICSIIICIGLIGYLSYQMFYLEPIRKQVLITVDRLIALDYGDSTLLAKKYQNHTRAVPADVVQQKKETIKKEMQEVFISDYCLFDTHLNSKYSFVDAQAKKQLVYPEGKQARIVWISSFSASGDDARMVAKVHPEGMCIETQPNGDESIYGSGEGNVTYEITLKKINGVWVVADYNFLYPDGV